MSDIRSMLGLKPGEGNRLALERELRRRVEAWDRPGFFYRGSADLLLQHGEFFVGQPIPEEYADLMGQPSACFDNAAHAAELRPELRYFQGMYATGGRGFTPHGWCVAPDGGVVEVTWPTRDYERFYTPDNFPIQAPDRVGYWGIEMRPELMRWCAEHDSSGAQCLLDRPASDFHSTGRFSELDISEADDLPLLRHAYDKTRVTF